MTPDLAQIARDAFQEALQIARSTAPIAAGLFGFLGSKREEDAIHAEANDVVLDALSDADQTRTIECLTGSDLRDQVTVEEAIELYEEAERRRFGWKWN